MKLQDRFPKNWSFCSHMALIGAVYSFVYAASNLLCFLASARKKQKAVSSKKSIIPMKSGAVSKLRRSFVCGYVKNPPKSCKVLNVIITAMLAIDIASFPLVKKIIEKDW